jgi:hypothetical protein
MVVSFLVVEEVVNQTAGVEEISQEEVELLQAVEVGHQMALEAARVAEVATDSICPMQPFSLLLDVL